MKVPTTIIEVSEGFLESLVPRAKKKMNGTTASKKESRLPLRGIEPRSSRFNALLESG
jgi:uncharacterized protein YjeT (DUF2065 family)